MTIIGHFCCAVCAGGEWWLLWVVVGCFAPFAGFPSRYCANSTCFRGIIDATKRVKGRGRSGGCADLMVTKRKLSSPSPSHRTLRKAQVSTQNNMKISTEGVGCANAGGGVMMALIELKPCKCCGKNFLGSEKRKFCSKHCGKKFRFRVYRKKRMLRDAEFKQRSLARLFAWKERKKREKQVQKQQDGGNQQVVVVDAFWI